MIVALVTNARTKLTTDLDRGQNREDANQKYRWKRIVLQIEHETTPKLVIPFY